MKNRNPVDEKIKYCTKCGKQNRMATRFCTGCGAPFPVAGTPSSAQSMPAQNTEPVQKSARAKNPTPAKMPAQVQKSSPARNIAPATGNPAANSKEDTRKAGRTAALMILALLAVIALGVGAFFFLRGRENRADRDTAAQETVEGAEEDDTSEDVVPATALAEALPEEKQTEAIRFRPETSRLLGFRTYGEFKALYGDLAKDALDLQDARTKLSIPDSNLTVILTGVPGDSAKDGIPDGAQIYSIQGTMGDVFGPMQPMSQEEMLDALTPEGGTRPSATFVPQPYYPEEKYLEILIDEDGDDEEDYQIDIEITEEDDTITEDSPVIVRNLHHTTETDAGTDTGLIHELYTPILDRYYNALVNREIADDMAFLLYYLIGEWATADDDPMRDAGFLIRDINEDGIPELIIFQDYARNHIPAGEWGAGRPDIIDMYTIADGKAVRIEGMMGGERFHCWLMENNNVLYEAGPNAFEFISEVLSIIVRGTTAEITVIDEITDNVTSEASRAKRGSWLAQCLDPGMIPFSEYTPGQGWQP